MKRTWDIEVLIEHFTLIPSELELLGNKTGATRLGFALLLKCFQPRISRLSAPGHKIWAVQINLPGFLRSPS